MKHLVTLSQAHMLRRLGYDEPCIFAINKHGHTNVPNGLRYINENGKSGYQKYSSANKHLIKRPTVSEACKWLRENHGIRISTIGATMFGYYWRLDNTPKTPEGIKYIDNRYTQNTPEGHLNDKCINKAMVEGYYEDQDDCTLAALSAMIKILHDRKEIAEAEVAEKELEEELS